MLALGRLKRLLDRNDVLIRFGLVRKLGKAILPIYRFKWPQMAWWNDDAFNAYLALFGELDGMNTDRRWMLLQLLRLVESTPGDTAECGVFQGASSYLICNANKRNPRYARTHHVFDSFEGLSMPGDKDGIHWKQGDMATSLDVARRNLAGFDQVVFYKGWIPDRFSEVAGRTFAFVHIDVDLADPTEESLRFFYPRMNRGGIILCDDYGFTSCPGATRVVDAYLADKKEKMLSLCCGGGFLVKDCVTAIHGPGADDRTHQRLTRKYEN